MTSKSITEKPTRLDVLPLYADELVALVAALLVQEANGVHELVDDGALLGDAARHLEVHVLGAADTADAAPAARVAGREADVVRLVARVRLELDAGVPVIVGHGLADQALLRLVCWLDFEPLNLVHSR